MLFDNAIFSGVMHTYVYLGVVGLILSTLPFIFYDLTRAKHDKCVAEIAAREAQDAPGIPEPETDTEVTAE